MLVLTRKANQKIQVGENVTITVVEVKGRYVRIGIDAPREVRIIRSEIPVERAHQEPHQEPHEAHSS